MPTVFRVECTHCGRLPETSNGVAGYVTTDGRKGGKILPEGYLALKLDDGEYVALPHPIEDSVLKQHGYAWIDASRCARLFRVTYLICVRCGQLQREYQHNDSCSGCLIGIVSVPITALVLKFWMGLALGLSLVVSYFVMMGVFGLVALVNWLRWHGANRSLKLTACPECGGGEFKTMAQAAGKTFPCPFCKTNNMRYTRAGIS
jgi:hypothetical protein